MHFPMPQAKYGFTIRGYQSITCVLAEAEELGAVAYKRYTFWTT